MAGIWKAVSSIRVASSLLGSCYRHNFGGISCSQSRLISYLTSSSSPTLTRQICNPSLVPCRYTSFFNRLPSEDLWKGVISVSNPGKKRGRGKGVGKKTAKNLNKGQVIGIGKVNMLWPGLNTPIIQGKDLIRHKKLPEDTEYKAKLLKLRDDMGAFTRVKLSPLQRGWSGDKLPGRSIGPPDPVGDEHFVGFDTKVLEFKTVCNMKGNLGRTRRLSAFVITGNRNGLAGFALGKAQAGQGALRKAKNRAAQKLMFIERYNNHTVLHDFYTQFGKTKIFVQKKPEGYGLVCHRAIKTICETIGIKDLYAKVEGSTKNIQHITKAFLAGLLHQKSYQQIAEETKLHVVEFRKERGDFPQVLASPLESPTKTNKDPTTGFNLFVMDGKVPSEKKKYPLYYTKLPSWQVHLSKTLRFRNHEDVKYRMMVEYGEIRSFLAETYPECRHVKYVKQTESES